MMSSSVENGPVDKDDTSDQCAENAAFDENNDNKPNSHALNAAFDENNDNKPNSHALNDTGSSGDHDIHNIILVDPKHVSPDVSHGDDMATMSSRRCCATCCLKHFSTKQNPLSANASFAQRLRFAFLCPPHGHVARTITLVFVVAYVWLTLWAVLGHEALPGGNYFALMTLLVLCVIAGEIVEKIHLPPLLGKYICVYIYMYIKQEIPDSYAQPVLTIFTSLR